MACVQNRWFIPFGRIVFVYSFIFRDLALTDASIYFKLYICFPGFLAVIDASTLGEFRVYAIPWQMSPGCQAAGFIGVLSSELSVYTLTVITLERDYAITHAMHLNKRLSLRHAAYVMLGGWVFAATMAFLPIAGISDYRKFAMCLPFETSGAGLPYVVSLMTINGAAFLVLMICYMKIYCSIRGSQAWNSNDSKIAKRMALLVFTDFICLAPIAFFSLTAAFGLHLISLEQAKVFTVFVLPFNSCCNPFLYALLTKQFKKDCVMLCKSIEESRVTRGIGRCRHSSNFSNRQTPANTNSAIEQSSKSNGDDCNCQAKKNIPLTLRQRMRISLLKFVYCHQRKKKRSANGYDQARLDNKALHSASTSSNSSSYYGNWRRGKVSLRILDRQKRTWYLTRKPSQESNLSSSRNDSSATTASTSTWRISRSSVSSDISSGASKILGKNDSQLSLRLGSLRDRRTENRNSNVIVMQHSPSRGDSFKRNKPKLERQSAVEKETYLSNKLTLDSTPCAKPAVRDNLSCVYEQESVEEEDLGQMQSFLPSSRHLSNISSFIPRKLSTISSHSTSGNKDELSSPDHHSCTVDPDTNTEELAEPDDVFEQQQPQNTQWRSSTRRPSYQYSRCPSDGDICWPQTSQHRDMRRTTTMPAISAHLPLIITKSNHSNFKVTLPSNKLSKSHTSDSMPCTTSLYPITTLSTCPTNVKNSKPTERHSNAKEDHFALQLPQTVATSEEKVVQPFLSQIPSDAASTATLSLGNQKLPLTTPPVAIASRYLVAPNLSVKSQRNAAEQVPDGMLETHFPIGEPPDEGHPLL